jgi:acetyltransferase EpsM
METRQIVIIGTGSEGRIAADVFTAMGHVVLGFLETDPDRNIRDLNDINVFSHYEEDAAKNVLKDQHVEFMVALGDMDERKRVYEKVSKRAKRPSANAIHPISWQSPYAAIGFGNLFNAASVINANTVVGDFNHFHSGVTVETDVVIGNYCNFNSGVRIGSNVHIEDGVFIGTGAIIHPGVHLGEGCLIGAGSVVLKTVEAGKRVFGNPAQSI